MGGVDVRPTDTCSLSYVLLWYCVNKEEIYVSCLIQVTESLSNAGLESSNLILGIDFTKSNEWTGKGSNLKLQFSVRTSPFVHSARTRLELEFVIQYDIKAGRASGRSNGSCLHA